MTKRNSIPDDGTKRDRVRANVFANIQRKRHKTHTIPLDLARLMRQLDEWEFLSTVCVPPGSNKGIRVENTNQIVEELLRRERTSSSLTPRPQSQLPPPSGSGHDAPGEREDGDDSGVMPPPAATDAAATASAVDGGRCREPDFPDDVNVLRALLAEERALLAEERRRREEAEAQLLRPAKRSRASRGHTGSRERPPEDDAFIVSSSDDEEEGGGGTNAHDAVQDAPDADASSLSDITHEVQTLLDTEIRKNGTLRRVGSLVNFDHETIADAYSFRGFVFLCSPEQTNKTMFIFVIALLCAQHNRPCMIVVALHKNQTKDLTFKMDDDDHHLLRRFGLEIAFCDNGGPLYNDLCHPTKVDRFRQGKLVVVMPSYAARKAHAFLELADARNVLLIADESDGMTGRTNVPHESREEAYVQLAGRPHDAASRTTGVIFVSATHLADAHFWYCVRNDVPCLPLTVDTRLLRERGYTTEEDMKLFATVNAQKDGGNKTMFGVTSGPFRALMRDFKLAPIRRKLMMIASCPYVAAQGRTTLQKQAEHILLELDPYAIILVHNRGKNVVMYNDIRVEEDQVQIYVGPNEVQTRTERHEVVTQNRQPQPRVVKDKRGRLVKGVSEALQRIERAFCKGGRDRRFIAIGYHGFNRSASVRTRSMVITHMFVMLSQGKDISAVRQTLMRCGGLTAHIRRDNCQQGGGGDDEAYVRVVTMSNDWWVSTTLPEFQDWYLNLDRRPESGVNIYTQPAMPIQSGVAVRGTARRLTAPAVGLDRVARWKVSGTPDEHDGVHRGRQEVENSANASATALLNPADNEVTSRRERTRGAGDEGGAALPPVAPLPPPPPPAATALHPDDVPTTSSGMGRRDLADAPSYTAADVDEFVVPDDAPIEMDVNDQDPAGEEDEYHGYDGHECDETVNRTIKRVVLITLACAPNGSLPFEALKSALEPAHVAALCRANRTQLQDLQRSHPPLIGYDRDNRLWFITQCGRREVQDNLVNHETAPSQRAPNV